MFLSDFFFKIMSYIIIHARRFQDLQREDRWDTLHWALTYNYEPLGTANLESRRFIKCHPIDFVQDLFI